jgi:osmotically-inducible protein OsmY
MEYAMHRPPADRAALRPDPSRDFRETPPDTRANPYYRTGPEEPYQAGGETRPSSLLGGSGGNYGGDDLLEAGSDFSFSQRGANQRGRGPRGYARSDERLREDICEMLTEDPDLDASEIEVSVNSGNVMLTGALGERWQKHHAENLVARCRGVRDVDNRIGVHKLDHTGDASEASVSWHGPHGKAVGGRQ